MLTSLKKQKTKNNFLKKQTRGQSLEILSRKWSALSGIQQTVPPQCWFFPRGIILNAKLKA